MRDTARVRVERAQDTVRRIVGRNGKARAFRQSTDFAEFAVAPIPAPAHGAEYARTLLWFVQQTINEAAAERMAKEFDKRGVIWRPADQVAAAKKQIGRMRSDVIGCGQGNNAVIPLRSLVYATDEEDFTGKSYILLSKVKLQVRHSFGDDIKLRVGRSWLPLNKRALRYVEGPMVRAR